MSEREFFRFVAVVFVIPMTLGTCSIDHDSTVGEVAQAQQKGFVLQSGEGEVLLLRPPSDGRIIIKVDAENARSGRVAMGIHQLPAGYRVPLHTHDKQDEIIFVHKGVSIGIIGDDRVQLREGATVYVPAGVWHGVENPADKTAELVWVIAPSGLEEFFRDIGTPIGTPREPLTDEEMVELNRKHGMTVKIDQKGGG